MSGAMRELELKLLEVVVLQHLRRSLACMDAKSVRIQQTADGKWEIEKFDAGKSLPSDCDRVLKIIVPELQNRFSLKPGRS